MEAQKTNGIETDEGLKAGESAEGRAENKEKEAQTIILRVNEEQEEDAVDLLNVAGNMKKRWRFFSYLMVLTVCVGFLLAALTTGVQGIFGNKSYAFAVITFSYDGIDEGLDPNGGLFDISKIKSTDVVNKALEELGWEDWNAEAVRANLKIEGVIPDSVKQQISVINTVAEKATEYYTTIQDLDYFPSQYTVTLQRVKGMSGAQTRELLDAILLSYRDYFMEKYADTSALGSVTGVLDIESYDYLQASEILESQIQTMENYVKARQKQAPGFRAASTGMSFQDLADSIAAVRRIDLSQFVSFVQSNSLTKDAGGQIDYYNYQIKQYNYQLQELQSQLSNVERMIGEYEKDPVIVMSSQESVTETFQANEYYDTLLSRKLELTERIGSVNTRLNEAYNMTVSISGQGGAGGPEDYERADGLLKNLMETVEAWTGLV